MGLAWNSAANAPVAGVPRTVVRLLLSVRLPSTAAAVANAATIGSQFGRATIASVLSRALWLPLRQVAVWNVTGGAVTSGGAWVHAVVLLVVPRGRFPTPFGTASGLLPPVVDATAVVNLRVRDTAASVALHATYDPTIAPSLSFAPGAAVSGAGNGGLTAPAAVAGLWQALAEATLEASSALQRALGLGCSGSVA